jgi:hemoglobin-like flavoprotein
LERRVRVRKKTWDEKKFLVRKCFNRLKNKPAFAANFYNNLFFLKPELKDYFKSTDFDHQEKALIYGMSYLFDFAENENDKHARTQFMRVCQTHSFKNLNVHPHHYYYWIEALIITAKRHYEDWFHDMEYYIREVLFLPISFMISQYFVMDKMPPDMLKIIDKDL